MDNKPRLFEESAEAEVPAQFDDDEFYRALAAQPRRRVLAHLLGREQCSVEELADVLCGWESEEGMVSPERHREVRIALVHSHLPRLEAAGLVSYDPEAERVTTVSLPGSVERLFQYSVLAGADEE